MFDNICNFLTENFSRDFASWILGQPEQLTSHNYKRGINFHPWFSTKYTVHNYLPFDGNSGTRTHNQKIKNLLLCQLSYIPRKNWYLRQENLSYGT